MPDAPRIRMTDDELRAFARVHVSAGPAEANDEALAIVRAEARRRAGGRTRSSAASRVWRLAGSGVAVAAILFAAAFALTPRVDDSAFARQQAVAALLPKDGVLHARAVFTGTGWNEEFGENPAQRQVWEDWIDAEKQVTRGQVLDGETLDVAELSVRVGNVSRFYAVSYELDTDDKKYVRLKDEVVVESPAQGDVTSPAGGLVDQLRELISTGKAEVVDRTQVGGVKYWVVEHVIKGEDGGKTTYTATLREGDYVLRSLVIEDQGKNGNGNWTGRGEWQWETWEVIERDSLPADFFSLEAPVKMARPGTKIEKREM